MKKGALLFLLVVVTLLAAVSNGRATGASLLAATLSSAPAWTSEGSEQGGEFAYAVALDGDYNDDGYNDLLLGAPKNSVLFDENEGIVEVYYGGPQGLADNPDVVYTGEEKSSYFGGAVACAGDVNGDGYDDALIGASRYGNGDSIPDAGAVYLFFGSEDGLQAAPFWKVVGDTKDGRLGYAVSSAGDVNGDGYADVLVGAAWYYHIFENEGAALLYLGSSTGLEAEPVWTTYGGQAVAAYGSAVSSAGDVDGDGYDDILIGAPGYSSDGERTGAVYLFYGSEDGAELSARWIEISQTPEARFGEAVNRAGDLNGDGFADLIIGAPGYGTESLLGAGAVFIYHGSLFGPGDAPDIQIFGDQEYSHLGNSVSLAGDINQDGFDDVAYGAYGYTDDQPAEGIVYAGLGSPGAFQLPVSWSATGDKANTSFGFCVSSAGDVNGDGLVDLVVGAPFYRVDEEILGRAFLFLGQIGDAYPIRVYLPLLKR